MKRRHLLGLRLGPRSPASGPAACRSPPRGEWSRTTSCRCDRRLARGFGPTGYRLRASGRPPRGGAASAAASPFTASGRAADPSGGRSRWRRVCLGLSVYRLGASGCALGGAASSRPSSVSDRSHSACMLAGLQGRCHRSVSSRPTGQFALPPTGERPHLGVRPSAAVGLGVGFGSASDVLHVSHALGSRFVTFSRRRCLHASGRR